MAEKQTYEGGVAAQAGDVVLTATGDTAGVVVSVSPEGVNVLVPSDCVGTRTVSMGTTGYLLTGEVLPHQPASGFKLFGGAAEAPGGDKKEEPVKKEEEAT